MRVYLPLTLPGLDRLRRTGEAGPAPLTAWAVTPALHEWFPSGSEEELEYAALEQAAEASLVLLAAEPGAARRRVVLAADVPEGLAAVVEAGEPGEVRLSGPVPLAKAAAVHVDAPEAVPDVTAAVRALEEAGHGDAEARRAVDGAFGHELLWFAVQEIDSLL
ncbi:DUF6912 family protein [Streptomyces sodiiphilus]